MLERLRPRPHRGPLIAAGAVALAVAVVVLVSRFHEEWGAGIRFAVELVSAAPLLAMAWLADDRPHPSVAVLLLTGLVLGLLALGTLAEILGADAASSSPGTVFWVSGAFAAAVLALWRARPVAVLLFVAALAAGVSLLTFVDWVFDPDGVQTFRWLLLLLVLAYLGGHAVLRERRRREAVLLVDAAGIAAGTLGITVAAGAVFGAIPLLDGGPTLVIDTPAGWELVVLLAGCGLVAFSAVEREPGPGFLGVVVLGIFAVLASLPGPGGASVLWWPLILLVVGVGAIGAGLRPARPLPPEPGPPGGGADPVPLRPE
jgi:hypothetical protein